MSLLIMALFSEDKIKVKQQNKTKLFIKVKLIFVPKICGSRKKLN